MRNIQIGILGSTRGTSLQPIIDAIEQKKLAATIQLVVSNKKDAYILERAKKHGLSAFFIDPAELTREAYDEKISFLIREHLVDLIILIGYMRILSNDFIKQWKNKIINVHPSLLPLFAGGMDKNVHQAVLNANMKETGCTVHEVTEIVDQGPILVQKACPVLPGDTAESLKARVQVLEGKALIEAIHQVRY